VYVSANDGKCSALLGHLSALGNGAESSLPARAAVGCGSYAPKRISYVFISAFRHVQCDDVIDVRLDRTCRPDGNVIDSCSGGAWFDCRKYLNDNLTRQPALPSVEFLIRAAS
jgi:hypothetical protein